MLFVDDDVLFVDTDVLHVQNAWCMHVHTGVLCVERSLLHADSGVLYADSAVLCIITGVLYVDRAINIYIYTPVCCVLSLVCCVFVDSGVC